MKLYREDTISWSSMFHEHREAAVDVVEALGRLAVSLLSVPVLLALKVWLPQLPEAERVRRKIVRRVWADADI